MLPTERGTTVEECRYKDAPGYRLSRGDLAVTVLPQGGKIQSIRWGGREWLWQRPGEAYRFARYGDVFETGEFSGFDDMFPTISPCPYPREPWAGISLPDHGEVWTLPWQCQPEDGILVCQVDGVALPYRLHKRVSLLPDALVLDYRAQNLSDAPLACLWAAHPLFVLQDGMGVELEGCQRIFNTAPDKDNLGDFGALHEWPVCATGRDLRRLGGAHHTYRKFYAWHPLAQNRAHLRYPGGVRITMEAPVEQVPYLGLWVDEAGYGGHGMRCVTPEPCTGAPDRLDWAQAHQREAVLPPGGEAVWRLTITFAKEDVL